MVELELVMTVGADRREFKLLPGGPPLVVGRGVDATYRIDAPLLSRRHFEIRFLDDRGLEIEDLKSANGTFLNGRLTQRSTLKPGDVIRAGDVAIKIEYDGAAKSSPPKSGAWIAEAVSGDLRCQRCGRLISMTTVRDDQTFEWGEQVLCPPCQEGSSSEIRLDALSEVEKKLKEEGFDVLERISAEGSLMPVFKAKRTGGLEDVVAIKALPLVAGLSEKKIERFKTEARLMALLKHPNVAHVYDVRTRPDLTFMVMEFIEGETLLKKIDREGKLPALEAMKVGLAVARALEAASKHGIVHRNVKPGNILIAKEDGTVKLIDFGLAKGVKAYGPGVTNEDETLGTVRYMPPEQVKDARAADARADMYALAATLFHALTGKLPYSNRSELDLLKHVVARSLPEFIITPTDPIPGPIAHVLTRALKKKPDERPATAQKFRELLAQAIFSISGGRALLSADDLATIPAQTVDAPAGTVQGSFDEAHPLAEVVQMLGINSKTGTLVVTAGEEGGELAFQGGRIADGKTKAGVSGEPGVLAVLALARGTYEFKPQLPTPFKAAFNRSVEGFLLEATKRKDERKPS